LLITPDTSVIHLASAYSVPVFGLYVHFNTDEMIWKPYNSDFECVITKERTLDSIYYEEVERKLKIFLEKHLPTK
jgi:ADP-heptose:LPS heptosyltransferase